MYPLPATSMRGHAFDGPDLGRQLRGDLLRRLPQLLGELKGRRHGHLAEIALPRLLDGDREIDAVAGLNVRVKRAGNSLFDGMEHGKSEYTCGQALSPANREITVCDL